MIGIYELSSSERARNFSVRIFVLGPKYLHTQFMVKNETKTRLPKIFALKTRPRPHCAINN